MKKQGVLLVNLGSPDSTAVGDVRRYLRQFLMDGRVIDAPYPIRFCIVNFLILPTRPRQSAEAYEKIWRSDGSPLVAMGKTVRTGLQQRVPLPVELAMRYQNPSIESAIANLVRAGVEDLVLLPLFPHYAMSSFETAVERVKSVLRKRASGMHLRVVPPYYNHPDFIKALAASAQPYLEHDYDHLLFSFHGLPERHLRKSDPTKKHCLATPDCCSKPSPAHATCYRAQCFQTAKAFVHETGVPDGKYSVSFQSRLGRDPWLQPYTDLEIERFPSKGIKKLLVMCPAFVADCLETLEEIGLRAQESFRQAGGAELTLVPCLNNHPRWLDALQTLVTQGLTLPRTNF